MRYRISMGRAAALLVCAAAVLAPPRYDAISMLELNTSNPARFTSATWDESLITFPINFRSVEKNLSGMR